MILDHGQERIGCEFKLGVAVKSDDWRHLQAGIDDGVIHRGVVIYNGTRSFAASEKISILAATEALKQPLS